MRSIFYKSIFLTAFVVLFASCDKDFNEIGADIIGDDHFDMELYSDVMIKAYDRKVDSVQSNNLPLNALGIYDNPVFGKTTANFVTQVEMINANPDFDANPVVLKAELTVPYFSRRDDFDAETGVTTYVLDSIWGSGKINLSVYESTYYLRDYDPETGFTQLQKYYSNQGAQFDANHGSQILNDDPSPAQNTEFFFDPAEVLTYEENDAGEQVIDDRLSPRMVLKLNKQFFQDKIFGPAASGNLINNNQFKQYFKGLYFKVQHAASNPNGGSLALMDFKQGKITITYEVDGEVTGERVEKTYVLNLTGNTVNVVEDNEKPEYLSALANLNNVEGDDKLYLKGGAGSVAVIELFGPDDPGDDDNVPEQLEFLRTEGWQVNDASLTFFIDAESMANSSKEPDRIFLYDIDNKRPLIDYYTDVTTVGSIPKYNKYIHDGIIQKVDVSPTERRGFKYRIRLTNHIRNLLNSENDSTNVRLGLSITENINNVSMAKLDGNHYPGLNNVVPVSSFLSQLGTIIYGSNPIVPADKKLKLEIYYTKEN